MPKFNLKNYEKVNGDEHIDMKLKEDHGEVPNEINEKQLEDYRSPEPTVVTEKQLEDLRNGGDDEILERRLDKKKASFDIKYRNPEAYEGDLNKLEEKRLLNDPMEDEKYEPASETPEAFRWWETEGSPDGLKLASTDIKKNVKVAQTEEELDFDSRRWQDVIDEEQDDDWDKINPLKEETFPEQSFEAGNMEIIKHKDILSPSVGGGTPYAGVYYILNYNPKDFRGDVGKIKETAISTILETRDELGGLISEEDLGSPKEEDGVGEISLRSTGDKFIPVLMGSQGDESGVRSIEEVNYTVENIGGTNTIIGEVEVEGPVENEEVVVREVLDFINSKHPDINVTEESIDTASLSSDGVVSFMVGAPKQDDFEVDEIEGIENLEEDIEDFEIEEEPIGVSAQAQNLKKK